MRLFSCVNDIVLVSLLLNLNIFHALFCFHCWLRTGWINLVVKQFSWKVSTGRKLGPYFCHIYLPNLKKCSWVHRKKSSTFLLFWAENRSSRSDVFCKKVILRSFAKFTGKQLCQSLFFNKVAGLRPAGCSKLILDKNTHHNNSDWMCSLLSLNNFPTFLFAYDSEYFVV